MGRMLIVQYKQIIAASMLQAQKMKQQRVPCSTCAAVSQQQRTFFWPVSLEAAPHRQLPQRLEQGPHHRARGQRQGELRVGQGQRGEAAYGSSSHEVSGGGGGALRRQPPALQHRCTLGTAIRHHWKDGQVAGSPRRHAVKGVAAKGHHALKQQQQKEERQHGQQQKQEQLEGQEQEQVAQPQAHVEPKLRHQQEGPAADSQEHRPQQVQRCMQQQDCVQQGHGQEQDCLEEEQPGDEKGLQPHVELPCTHAPGTLLQPIVFSSLVAATPTPPEEHTPAAAAVAAAAAAAPALPAGEGLPAMSAPALLPRGREEGGSNECAAADSDCSPQPGGTDAMWVLPDSLEHMRAALAEAGDIVVTPQTDYWVPPAGCVVQAVGAAAARLQQHAQQHGAGAPAYGLGVTRGLEQAAVQAVRRNQDGADAGHRGRQGAGGERAGGGGAAHSEGSDSVVPAVGGGEGSDAGLSCDNSGAAGGGDGLDLGALGDTGGMDAGMGGRGAAGEPLPEAAHGPDPADFGGSIPFTAPGGLFFTQPGTQWP